MITVGTDCSGIEAPIEALRQLKIPHRHVWSCEIDKFAVQSIMANYDPETIYTDITTRDHSKLPHVDLYVCGFPCQPFSAMGNKLGTKDKRGNVMKECIAVIRAARPKVFILENVKHFRSAEEGKPYRYLMGQLDRIGGYHIYVNLLNTKDYGIPQNRERLYVVGILTTTQTIPFQVPSKSQVRPLDAFLDNLIAGSKHHLTQRDIRLLKEHRNIDVSELEGNYVVVKNRYISCMKDVCPTLATKRNHYLVKYQRYLWPEEYLYLQGFPRSFRVVVSNSQIIKQAGNSMSVNVLKAMFVSLRDSTKLFRDAISTQN
jgi:DNA (cytosine-5)-methyltransferase 1